MRRRSSMSEAPEKHSGAHRRHSRTCQWRANSSISTDFDSRDKHRRKGGNALYISLSCLAFPCAGLDCDIAQQQLAEISSGEYRPLGTHLTIHLISHLTG